MQEKDKDTLTFSGKLLVPGFSIYLMTVTIDGVFSDEIKETLEEWFYIGMTGDNHYPSARSAFHRISGHLQLAGASTQNQLYQGIKGLVGDQHRVSGQFPKKNWEDVNITMKSFPVPGFNGKHWLDLRAEDEDFKFSKAKMREIAAKNDDGNEYTDANYRAYKEKQREVAAFEKKMIRYAKGKFELKEKSEHLFNKATPDAEEFDARPFGEIAAGICEWMKIEW